LRILFIGDIDGRPGREAAAKAIPQLRAEYGDFDFVIADGENAAGGFGLTEKVMNELFSYGIDILTNGNHVWDKKDFIRFLDSDPRLLRPANHPEGTPGRGFAVYENKGRKLAVMCLLGRAFMPPLDCPFRTAEKLLADNKVPAVFVDFHGEATSEKYAMGRWLDGKVSAVVGTHTHVQTADEQVLPGGTAFICDAGMTGGHGGVIGMTYESVLPKFLYGTPTKFEICDKNVRFQAVVVEIDDETGRGMDIRRVDIPCEI
jgi:metallophosphoesterase (TIGR00282 family)